MFGFFCSLGSLQGIDVVVFTSLLQCSLAPLHLFFPHKNSSQEEGRRERGMEGEAGQEGLLVEFVLAPCLERKLSLLDDL